MAGWGKNDVRAALAENDIESRSLWKPMHLQPVYADRPSYVNGSSESLFERGLALPSGSGLTTDDTARVTSSIQTFLGARS